MIVKIIPVLIILFLGSFVLSESGKIENEVEITKLIEKIVAEKTSELTSKVLSLENIVVNQQKQIDRLEKQDKRKGKIITNILTTFTDIRQEKEISLESATGEDNTENSNSDSHHRSEVLTGLHLSNGSENEVSNVRQAKHIGKSRQRRQTEVVAFTAYLSHNIDHMSNGHHIVFDKIITNDGAGYNVHTGIFTVPVTGLYLFTFSINDHYRISVIQLVVDGTNIVDIVDSPANNIESMSSNTVVLHVNKGQSVWLQEYITQDGSIFTSESYRYCTFSGVLLY